MPQRVLPYFTQTSADARVAELPPHFQRRASKLSKAGSGITLSHGKPLSNAEHYQSSLQRDFTKNLTDGLMGDVASAKPLSSSIRIKFSEDSARNWNSTMNSFNTDMVNRHAAMSKPNQPDVGVHWNFGEEKNTYTTQMTEDMNIDFALGHEMNKSAARDRGPIRSCVQLGNEHAEPKGGDPERYRPSAAENFRNFTFEEADAARGKSAAQLAGGRSVGTKTAVQFGGGHDDLSSNLRYRTTSIMSNVAPDEEVVRNTTLPPAKPIRSKMKIADGPATIYATNYGDDFKQSGEETIWSGPPKSNNKSAISIGDRRVNPLTYATAASSDYIDFGTDTNPPVQPDNRSKVVLGMDYTAVKWISVNNDRVDPSLVPNAYVNARDEKGYKGQKTLKQLNLLHVDPKAEFEKRMQILGADATYKMPYQTTYKGGMGLRNNKDCETSKRSASTISSSTFSLKETEDEKMTTSYRFGSGVNVTTDQVRAAHRKPNEAGNDSRVDISMSGVKDSYETAATADYVIPPPYKQLPRCTPAAGGGAAKASKTGAKITWHTSSQDSFQDFHY